RRFLREYHSKLKGGPLPSESVHHILVDKYKEVWVATEGGLMRHPEGTNTWEQSTTIDKKILRNPQYLLQNANAELLCLAEGGVWRKIPDRNAVFEKILNIPADIQLPSFFYQDSLLGICIPPIGRFEKKNGVWTRVANFNIPAVNSMLWDTILQSHWLGTDNGLILLDGKTKQIVTYAESDGLENSHINGMILDFYGNLWFGTNKGIIRFKVRKEDFLTKSKARNYNISDGLQDNSFGRFAASVDRSGNFLFGGLKGFNSFDPLRLFEYGQLPKIAITGIEINDRDTVPPIRPNLLSEITLMPYQTTFAISFSGIDFADPNSIMFRTRLDGYDREWITKKEGLVRYSNLKPGTYVLKIKAANADGQWTPESRNLTITIKPPIWNYWFVKLFAFLLLIGTTYLLVHANTERQLERQKLVFEKQQAITDERSRIAADMHDDLGSGLSMITLMSDIASVKAKDPDQAEAIKQIGVTSNELIDKMGEIIWTLNSRNDTIESLFRYIRQFASKLFDVTDIEWTMNIQDHMPEMTCPGKLRRNIFLTSKEALHNIVKHSKASNANIQASIHENVLIISITDNGKGIESHKINQFGNGMTNMRKRIEDIGGQFSMISEQGTEILIRVPIDLFDSIVKEG
ncbi:MAG: triple tyrosine motif-containing protein, partial [Saprospiraceae bacterium]